MTCKAWWKHWHLIYTGEPKQKSWERTILEGRTLQFLTAPTPDGGNATIATNITERKRAEEKLKQQNIRLREEIEAHGRSKATIEYLVDEIKSRHNFEEIIGEVRSPGACSGTARAGCRRLTVRY